MGTGGWAWTAEQDDALRDLCAQKLPFSRIAVILSCSRNSAIGRAHRLGIRNGRLSRSEEVTVKRIVSFKVQREKPMQPEPEPEPQPAPPSGGVHILDLTLRTCRWPAWGHQEQPSMVFCGGTVAPGSVYCATHRRVAYSTPTQRDAGRRGAAEIGAGRR